MAQAAGLRQHRFPEGDGRLTTRFMEPIRRQGFRFGLLLGPILRRPLLGRLAGANGRSPSRQAALIRVSITLLSEGLTVIAVLLSAHLATQAAPTDFGIRTVGGMTSSPTRLVADPAEASLSASPAVFPRQAFSLSSASRVASRFGRITSTVRNRDHNRRVGGAANSWHLHGRAIDVARQPGVSHAQIAAELRRRGFILIESLDEGDHSHFAFGDRLPRGVPGPRAMSEQVAELRQEARYFRFVSAPAPSRSISRLASSGRLKP